jgi:hypothetical protein
VRLSASPSLTHPHAGDALADEVAALSLAARRYRTAAPFAGGFVNPRDKALPPAPHGHDAAFTAPHHGVWPMPAPMVMPMPMPESRTMGYARADGPLGFALPPPPPPPLAHRRRSAPLVPPPARKEESDSDVEEVESISAPRRKQHLQPPALVARPMSDPAIPPSTPKKRTGRSASVSTPGTPGTPGSPGAASDTVQCSGMTQAGAQCKRRVRARAPLAAQLDPDAADDAPVERFCPQHAAAIVADTTFFAGRAHKRGAYADWLGAHLSEPTRVALRLEMHKAPSGADKPGYIYGFQIMDGDAGAVRLKVGRTANVQRRISQWGKQCGSHEHILRGYWPGALDAGADIVKGRIRSGDPGPCAAKLERLVHLELADLVAYAPYQTRGWPDAVADAPASAAGSPKKGARLVRSTCEDCASLSALFPAHIALTPRGQAGPCTRRYLRSRSRRSPSTRATSGTGSSSPSSRSGAASSRSTTPILRPERGRGCFGFVADDVCCSRRALYCILFYAQLHAPYLKLASDLLLA